MKKSAIVTNNGQHNLRLLAVDPTTKGFGFVLFEGKDMLVDWGTVEVNGRKNPACLEVLDELLDRYYPDVLVLEDGDGPGSRRSPRVLSLLSDMEGVAESKEVKTAQFSRGQIRNAFSKNGTPTKDEIAEEIARHFPGLKLRLPPERKPWMCEDERMALFDAASLAITFFEAGRSDSTTS